MGEKDSKKGELNGYENVCIADTHRTHIKAIRSKSSFFESLITYRVSDDTIIFEKPTEMFNGNTIKPQKGHSGWWAFQIVGENIPAGKYKFEDDIDEDVLMIYFK